MNRIRGGDARQNADLRAKAQELKVARLVAQGTTNREAAEAVFLSNKTIEFLLSQSLKHGLRSRTELACTFLLDRSDTRRVGPTDTRPDEATRMAVEPH